MFEINKYMINKMGWVNYSSHRGIGHGLQVFADDPLVRYFIDLVPYKTCYIIKELSDSEKQKSKNLYKYIKMDYNSPKHKFTVTEFNSNYEMFKLIIKDESCNPTYQRHIKLNKILK